MLFISMPSAWQLVEQVFAPDIRQLGKNQFFGMLHFHLKTGSYPKYHFLILQRKL